MYSCIARGTASLSIRPYIACGTAGLSIRPCILLYSTSSLVTHRREQKKQHSDKREWANKQHSDTNPAAAERALRVGKYLYGVAGVALSQYSDCVCANLVGVRARDAVLVEFFALRRWGEVRAAGGGRFGVSPKVEFTACTIPKPCELVSAEKQLGILAPDAFSEAGYIIHYKWEQVQKGAGTKNEQACASLCTVKIRRRGSALPSIKYRAGLIDGQHVTEYHSAPYRTVPACEVCPCQS